MRMRLGAPLLAALVSLLGAVQHASASHCGAEKYTCCAAAPCCDAQCCFTACQQQCCTCYKLVYDQVLEKRWHTCYKTVHETVMKPVCATIRWKGRTESPSMFHGRISVSKVSTSA